MNISLAQTMALDLMGYYRLDGWSFKFDRSVTRLGLCSHRRKMISLGKHATSVNSQEQVIGTILHEIAHALVGSQAGHGPLWVAKAIEIGHSGERCGTITVHATPKAFVKCGSCSEKWPLHRVTKRYTQNLDQMWCKTCGREKSKGKICLEVVK